MPRLYIIGPVTGMPNANFGAFESARARLMGRGYEAITPHDFISDGIPWPEAMRVSINVLTRYEKGGRLYDGVAMLPGWEDSEGARLEKLVAEACGIPCRTVDEWMEAADVD